MTADPRDDFACFAGLEHMFYSLDEPYAMMRERLAEALRGQVADTEVEYLRCTGQPKWLTLGRKVGDGTKMIVTAFAFCVQAQIAVVSGGGQDREEMPAALTFLFAKMDEPGNQVSSMFLDLHGDAQTQFADPVFQQRFAEFRARVPDDE